METTVSCPYFEPNCGADAVPAGSTCAGCNRHVKRCVQCATRNRAVANFCRGCGAELAASAGNWAGYKGGPQRLGVNATPPPVRPVAKFDFTAAGDLQLGDPCRSLLGLDGLLIAIAQNGTVAIAEPGRSGAARFQATGPTCEPCIDRGVLYIGSRGQLNAYSLGSTTMTAPHLRPLWHVPLTGTPIQALAVAAGRLYVTVSSGGAKHVQVIDRISTQAPAAPRTLYAGTNVSWLAADAARGRAVFFAEDGGGVMLHIVDAGVVTERRPTTLTQLSDHPIALAGDNVFGIFGDQQRLYRIDVATGEVAEALGEDTQSFSIRFGRDTEWERDAVRLDSDGIVFSRSGPRDAFSQHDRAVRGSPLIVRGRAAVVAMRDRILMYDLVHPPTHHVWRLKSRGGTDSSITALVSFDHFVAAGNDQGMVEIVALAGPAGAGGAAQ